MVMIMIVKEEVMKTKMKSSISWRANFESSSLKVIDSSMEIDLIVGIIDLEEVVETVLGIEVPEKRNCYNYGGEGHFIDSMIMFVKEVKVDHQFGYRFLDSITVVRDDKKEYTFKESDFIHLNLNDIEDMYVPKAIDSSVEINSVARVIDLENVVELVLGVEVPEVQDKSVVVIITGEKVTSLVSV
ncbi:hypothetical protein Tco_1236041 [Tanacetum coccineum]